MASQPLRAARPLRPASNPYLLDHAWFRDRMDDFGYSNRDMAEILGIERAAFIRLLNGERKLQIDEALWLARSFQTPLREILFRAGFDLAEVELE